MIVKIRTVTTAGENASPTEVWTQTDLETVSPKEKGNLLARFYNDRNGDVVLVPNEDEGKRLLAATLKKSLGLYHSYTFPEGWHSIEIAKEAKEKDHHQAHLFLVYPLEAEDATKYHRRVAADIYPRDFLDEFFPDWNK